MKSPLRYPGGKTRSLDIIASHFPEKFSEYREPFVGGGSVFLYVKETRPKVKCWINDLYEELFNFYRECRYHSKNVIKTVIEMRNTHLDDGKNLFNKSKEILTNKHNHKNNILRSACFFVINRTSFSGTTMSGGYSESAFKSRFTDSSIERLKDFCKALKPKLRITNFDFQKVVEKEGENVFMYIDPPYYVPEKSKLYGEKGNMHDGFDHERLAKTLKETKHKWLMTYDDCEYIRNLYSWANIVPFEASYGMNNVGGKSANKGKEIIIKNY